MRVLSSYETSDGQKRTEQGSLTRVEGSEIPVIVISGSYSWRGPDGIEYGYDYIADEKGYRVMVPEDNSFVTLPHNAVLSLIG